MKVVVRSKCLRKVMALYDHDGNRKAPKGGILLFASESVRASIFPTERAATLAINRTIKHRAKLGMESEVGDFEIQSELGWAAEEEAKLAPAKGKRKKS